MCLYDPPQQVATAQSLPAQPAAAKAPSYAQAQSAGQRTSDTIRSATPTILTSPSGVLDFAKTQKKTLLGQ